MFRSLLAALAACNTRGGEDTARVGEGSDTSITTRQTQDTTIVSSDTTVKVDTDTTVKEGEVKRGGTTTRRDTTKGEAAPMGERGAEAADQVADEPNTAPGQQNPARNAP